MYEYGSAFLNTPVRSTAKSQFPFYIPSVTARFEEYIGNVYQVSGTAGSGDWNLWKALDK